MRRLLRRSAPTPHGQQTRMSWRDLVSEAVAGLAARPGRTALTVLGTVLGISALVATVGIAQTAGNRIVGAFDELTATSVVITNETSSFAGSQARAVIPADAEERVGRLNGVRAVGAMGPVDIGDAAVSAVRLDDPGARDEFTVDLLAATPGLLPAVGGRLTTGRWFDAGHDARADPVAVLGPAVAARLRITRVDQQPVVFIGERPLVVIGILADVERQPALLDAVIIPDGTARDGFGYRSPTTVQIDVALGAGEVIAAQAPIALRPNDPQRLRAEKPPDPDSLRNRVQVDINSLFLVLGGISLLVGAIGIANVTLVSVLERVGEIGLRGALGARRRHIAAQFLLESTAMGLIGGVVGASLGVLAVVAVAAARDWTPVTTADSEVDPETGEALGFAVGGCTAEGEEAAFGDTAAQAALSGFYEELDARIEADPRGQELRREWQTCMSEAGFDDFENEGEVYDYAFGDFADRVGQVLGFDALGGPSPTPEQIAQLEAAASPEEAEELWAAFREGALAGVDRTALQELQNEERDLAVANTECSLSLREEYEELFDEVEGRFMAENADRIAAAVADLQD